MDRDTYSSMGSNLQNDSPFSPRSNARTMASSTPELTRFSRSQTMIVPGGSVTSGSKSPTSPYKKRSSTHLSYQASAKYLTKSTPSDFQHLDLPTSPQGGSHTLAHLQRSKTTKPSPVSPYGKSMWEEDEYVETGVTSPARTPAGGSAARRINQQRKMQTVNLPKNPFIDPETTADYADMTGHMSDKSGMSELRQAHQYKSLTTRGHNTPRQPLGEVEVDGVTREFDVEMSSRERNLSMSSSRSGSETTRFRRCDTSPALALRTQDSRNVPYDVQRNGSVRSAQHPALDEVDGMIDSPVRMTSSTSSNTMYSERQNSYSKSNVSRTLSSTMKPQLSAPSPDHSIASKETAATYLPTSTPASPAVVYKSNDNVLEPNVAIVIEETGPTSPMYGQFSDSQKSRNGATLKDDSEKRDLRFDAAPSTKSKCKFIIPIVIAVLLIIGLAVGVGLLAMMYVQQAQEINQLKERLSQVLSQTTSASISVIDTTGKTTAKIITTSLLETTSHVDVHNPQTQSTTSSYSTTTGSQPISETESSYLTLQPSDEGHQSEANTTGNSKPTVENKSTVVTQLSTIYTTDKAATGTQQTEGTTTNIISTSYDDQTVQVTTTSRSVETVKQETTAFMNATV